MCFFYNISLRQTFKITRWNLRTWTYVQFIKIYSPFFTTQNDFERDDFSRDLGKCIMYCAIKYINNICFCYIIVCISEISRKPDLGRFNIKANR